MACIGDDDAGASDVRDVPGDERAAYRVNGGVLALLRPPPATAARAENVTATVLTHLASFLFLHEVLAAQCVCGPWHAALKGAPAHGLFRCLSPRPTTVDAGQSSSSPACERLPPRVDTLWRVLRARRLLSIQIALAGVAGAPALVPHPYEAGAPTEPEAAKARDEARRAFGEWRTWLVEATAVAQREVEEDEQWRAWLAEMADAPPDGAEGPEAAQAKTVVEAAPAKIVAAAATKEGEREEKKEKAHASMPEREVGESADVCGAHANAVRSLQVYCRCDHAKLPPEAPCCQQVVYDLLRVRDAAAGPLACELAFGRRASPQEGLAVAAICKLAALWATTLVYHAGSCWADRVPTVFGRVRALSTRNPTAALLRALAVAAPGVAALETHMFVAPQPWNVAQSSEALPWPRLREWTWRRQRCAACAARTHSPSQQEGCLAELQAVADRSAGPPPLVRLRCAACDRNPAPAASMLAPHRRASSRCTACWSASPAAAACANKPYCAVARLLAGLRTLSPLLPLPPSSVSASSSPASPLSSTSSVGTRSGGCPEALGAASSTDVLAAPRLHAIDRPLRFEASFSRPRHRHGERVCSSTAYKCDAGRELRWELCVSLEVPTPRLFGRAAAPLVSLSLAETVLEIAYAHSRRVTADGGHYIGVLLDMCVKALADIDVADRLGLELAVRWANAGTSAIGPRAAVLSGSMTGDDDDMGAPPCRLDVCVRGSDRLAQTNQQVAKLFPALLHVFRTTALKAGHEF